MALSSRLSLLLIVFLIASIANAEEKVFGYKGILLGSPEADLKRKIKDASCYTNRLEKTRECVIRNSTYMNNNIPEIRLTYIKNKLAKIVIELEGHISIFEDNASDKEKIDRSVALGFVCIMGNLNVRSNLEELYGTYHKNIQGERAFDPKKRGIAETEWYYWYGSGSMLTFYTERIPINITITASQCSSKISMELDNYYELLERATHGRSAIEDM